MPAGARLAPPERLAALLTGMRQAPAGVPEAVCAELDMLAWHCVQQRRAGCTPSLSATVAHMQAVANNLPLRRALQAVGQALHARGLAAIVYKGHDYLARVYGDLGARAMADVDLVIRADERAQVERALLDAGFIADPHCPTVHERKFCRDGVAIDVHYSLLQPARMAIDHDALFERALPHSEIPGLLVLDPTDAALVHCIAQTVRGYYLPASSYVELQALLDRADSRALLARAMRWDACSALYSSLCILGRLGHARAAHLATRVPVSGARRLVLDGVVARFALRTFTEPRPHRMTLLALKVTLIDRLQGVARYVPQWCALQVGLTGPPALARAS